MLELVPTSVPTLIYGGSGYVAGELLRLTVGHPDLHLAGVVSESNAGSPIAAAFPHLAPALGDRRFLSADEGTRLAGQGPHAVFLALPHGQTAPVLAAIDGTGHDHWIVDLSADHRLGSASEQAGFTFALPEFADLPGRPRVAHPGCFTTATTLAAAPLVALRLAAETLTAFGVTGSSGSGRTPSAGTHHPDRHSGFYAYAPLRHRHQPEMEALLAQFGELRLSFLPHSGPWVRGIHVTIHAAVRSDVETPDLVRTYEEFYAACPFVRVVDSAPSVKHVAGSNFAHIWPTAHDGQVAVMAVIDNLVKGAAGGAVQWMNRLIGRPQTAGLDAPAIGWN